MKRSVVQGRMPMRLPTHDKGGMKLKRKSLVGVGWLCVYYNILYTTIIISYSNRNENKTNEWVKHRQLRCEWR